MSLVYDRREELAGQPACHALIVGISDYAHLGGPGQPPGEYSLRKLDSAALTAFRMCQWLLKRKDDLSAKLATCRLLLAPSRKEMEVEPALSSLPHDCTYDALEEAALAWREDCRLNKKHLAFFHYSGHGVQRTAEDSILLTQRFGRPGFNPMREAVSLMNIFGGMAQTAESPDMAMAQLYFVDACRSFPQELKDFDVNDPQKIFKINLGNGRDDRHAPIFFGSVPDSNAYGRVGKTSVFGEALLQCLEIAADIREDSDGKLVYAVDSDSLTDCLNRYFEALPADQRRDQSIVPNAGMLPKNVEIQRLSAPPLIPVTIELTPVERFGPVGFTFEDFDNGSIKTASWSPSLKNYVEVPLLMGTYRLDVTPDPHIPLTYRKSLQITPPSSKWAVRA
jgi:hypothetical protein